MSDVLLAPEARPFAVAAAIMVGLGGIELLTMLAYRSASYLARTSSSTLTTPTRWAACFSGSMRGASRS